MITLKVDSFITHKKAESLDDCQDAIRVNEADSRYAVADGATRSFLPKQWAELLVERFCEMPNLSLSEENWKEWLIPIQEAWYKQVEERVKVGGQFYLTNPFNAREPAVSTFVGLEVEKTKREWRAVVVGDSCLFHKIAVDLEVTCLRNQRTLRIVPRLSPVMLSGITTIQSLSAVHSNQETCSS